MMRSSSLYLFVFALFFVGCTSPLEKRLDLEKQKAEWTKKLEALPEYPAALDEGMTAALLDSGMTADERKRLESKFGEWDKKKVQAGMLRLCLSLGKMLSQNPEANVGESGIPETSPALIRLVNTEGFQKACVELFQLEQQLASLKKKPQ